MTDVSRPAWSPDRLSLTFGYEGSEEIVQYVDSCVGVPAVGEMVVFPDSRLGMGRVVRRSWLINPHSMVVHVWLRREASDEVTG